MSSDARFLPFFLCLAGLSLPGIALAQDPCPDVISPLSQSIDGWITRQDNGCAMTEGKFIKKNVPMQFDAHAESLGQCQIRYWDSNLDICKDGALYTRKVGQIQLSVNGSAVFDRVFGRDPVTGLGKNYPILDSTDLAKSTGPMSDHPNVAGSYTYKFKNQLVYLPTVCEPVANRPPGPVVHLSFCNGALSEGRS